MKYYPSILLLIIFVFSACIGDDLILDSIAERISIITSVDSLQIDDQFQLEARYTNQVGAEEMREVSWTSLNPQIASVDAAGLVTGLALGDAAIMAMAEGRNGMLRDTLRFVVTAGETVVSSDARSGTIKSTSSYELEGSFTLEEVAGQLQLNIADDYKTTSALPGLYIYLTNNPSTNANAFEIGEVKVFTGAHSYSIDGVPLHQYDYLLYYCKPFGVKVGEGEIE